MPYACLLKNWHCVFARLDKSYSFVAIPNYFCCEEISALHGLSFQAQRQPAAPWAAPDRRAPFAPAGDGAATSTSQDQAKPQVPVQGTRHVVQLNTVAKMR